MILDAIIGIAATFLEHLAGVLPTAGAQSYPGISAMVTAAMQANRALPVFELVVSLGFILTIIGTVYTALAFIWVVKRVPFVGH